MIPRFVIVAVGIAVTSLLLSFAVAYEIHRISDSEARHDCQRAVGYRDDNRAMWVYLVDQNNSDTANQARVDAFVAELNKRLPALHCDGDNPVPLAN